MTTFLMVLIPFLSGVVFGITLTNNRWTSYSDSKRKLYCNGNLYKVVTADLMSNIQMKDRVKEADKKMCELSKSVTEWVVNEKEQI